MDSARVENLWIGYIPDAILQPIGSNEPLLPDHLHCNEKLELQHPVQLQKCDQSIKFKCFQIYFSGVAPMQLHHMIAAEEKFTNIGAMHP